MCFLKSYFYTWSVCEHLVHRIIISWSRRWFIVFFFQRTYTSSSMLEQHRRTRLVQNHTYHTHTRTYIHSASITMSNSLWCRIYSPHSFLSLAGNALRSSKSWIKCNTHDRTKLEKTNFHVLMPRQIWCVCFRRFSYVYVCVGARLFHLFSCLLFNQLQEHFFRLFFFFCKSRELFFFWLD